MTRLAWKVFISSKACRLIVILWQEFIRHLFGKLLFPFVSLDTAISYKVKKEAQRFFFIIAYTIYITLFPQLQNADILYIHAFS